MQPDEEDLSLSDEESYSGMPDYDRHRRPDYDPDEYDDYMTRGIPFDEGDFDPVDDEDED